MQRSEISQNPKVMSWHGRVLIYSGFDVKGKQAVLDALRIDPDNVDAQKAVKAMKQSAAMKEKASETFKKEDYKQAVELFDQCLKVDVLNLNYNSVINLNKSIALGKLK
jgi:hypothetical protein